jgi:transmembrane sensor
LEEGKVKLGIFSGEDASELVMQPGDMVEVSGETRQVERKKVEVDNYSSWRNNKLTFVGSSLEDIAQLLEDNYGYKVTFGDESLKEKRFTGSVSIDSLDELFQKLNIIFEMEIQQDSNQLIFK